MKKLLSIALCICLTLAAVFTAVPSFATKANADTEAAQALLDKYSAADYVKHSEIYAENFDVANNAENFHAQASSLIRETLYVVEEGVVTKLYMSNVEGVNINSGYKNGDKGLEHFKYVNGEETVDYTVAGKTVRSFFVMLDEIDLSGEWNGTEMSFDDLEPAQIETWVHFIAPMWTVKVDSLTFSKGSIEEKGEELYLQLYSGETKFAQAIVRKAGMREVEAGEPETKKYTFSSYTAGTQYAKNEEHELDDDVTCVTNDCHFTTQLRIYSSNTNNGYAIFKSTKPITAVGVNAGNKADTLNIYGSNDEGSTWDETGSISVTSTSYKDYSTTLGAGYEWIKIDVEGSNQVRLASITLTMQAVGGVEHDHFYAYEVKNAPTCTADGEHAGKCYYCESTDTKTLRALGHNYVDGVCTHCKQDEPKESWKKATSIAVGDTIVIVCEAKSMQLNGISTTSTKYGLGVSYTDTPVGVYTLTVVAGSTDGTFAFKTEDGKYLTWTSGNSLNVATSITANSSWNVTFSNGNAIIKNASDSTRQLQWNASSPRFACYGNSGQTAIQIYKPAN